MFPLIFFFLSSNFLSLSFLIFLQILLWFNGQIYHSPLTSIYRSIKFDPISHKKVQKIISKSVQRSVNYIELDIMQTEVNKGSPYNSRREASYPDMNPKIDEEKHPVHDHSLQYFDHLTLVQQNIS